MNKNPLSYINYLFRQCQKYGLNQIRFISAIFVQLYEQPNNPGLIQMVKSAIQEAKQLQLYIPDPFRPTNPINEGIFTGNLILGKIPPYSIIYLIKPEDLKTHMLIASRSGGGKSNLIFLIALQLLESTSVSVKIFDRKFEYFPLMQNKRFTYFLMKDFYFNVLQPIPGESFEVHVTKFAEVLGNTHDIRVASRSLFVKVAIKLYQRPEFSGSGRFPTLIDVLNYLKGMKIPLISHEARHKETLINRIEGILNVFAEHLSSHRQLIWENFVNYSWGIDLNGIPTDYQNFFINVISANIIAYSISNNLRNSGIQTVLIFDEASSVFKKSFEQQEGTYLLLDYLAQAREFGIGFVIATQSLSNLPDSVLSNTGIKIMVGGFGSGTDYNIFASSTGMSMEQKIYLQTLTMPGQACVKDLHFKHPFTMEIPHIVE